MTSETYELWENNIKTILKEIAYVMYGMDSTASR